MAIRALLILCVLTCLPCHGAEPPCQHGLETPREGAPPRQSSLRLASISPVNGSQVTSATWVTAQLDYTISSFRRGAFMVEATLRNTDRTSTTAAIGALPPLQYPRGSIQLCIPLATLWNATQLQWPLELEFALGRRMGSGTLIAAAHTPAASYAKAIEVASVPVDTKPMPAPKRPELVRAITELSQFIADGSAQMFVCLEDHETLRAKIVDPIQRWHEDNLQFHGNVHQLFADVLFQNGLAAIDIQETFEQRHKSLMTKFRADPAKSSAQACELLPAKLATHDFDPQARFPRQFAIVTAHIAAYPRPQPKP